MHDSLLPPHHRFLMVIFNCFCKLWEDYNSVFFIRQPTILIYILIIFNTKLSKLLYYSFLYSYMASSFLIDSSTISFVILYGLWSISFISTAIFAISSSCELSNSKSFNLVGSHTLLLNSYTFLKSSSLPSTSKRLSTP